MRYFEVVLSGDCDDSELSICILGEDKPTISEAELFCKDDISLFKCSGISEIIELSREEAYQSFDMSCESRFPIFKRKQIWGVILYTDKLLNKMDSFKAGSGIKKNGYQ